MYENQVQRRELDGVVELENTYGYDPNEQEQQQNQDGDLAWLKLLLGHLKEKKLQYMKPIVPAR